MNVHAVRVYFSSSRVDTVAPSEAQRSIVAVYCYHLLVLFLLPQIITCITHNHKSYSDMGINLLTIITSISFRSWLWRIPLGPITVAARSKAWTVFARSNAVVVGSNPTQGIDVCVRLFCICVVLCVGRGLATGWSPVKGVLPTVYRMKKLKKRPRSNKGL
jgi:hypothetical protein